MTPQSFSLKFRSAFKKSFAAFQIWNVFYDGGCSKGGGRTESNRQCGCKELRMFMLMACWWLGGPPRKLSCGRVAAAMAANRGGAPPPPNRAKEGGRRGRAESRSFSISASCSRFAFARRFWNQIFTCKEYVKYE